jgi:hypothetical protein
MFIKAMLINEGYIQLAALDGLSLKVNEERSF